MTAICHLCVSTPTHLDNELCPTCWHATMYASITLFNANVATITTCAHCLNATPHEKLVN